MYVYYNPSPIEANVGDCTIRALTKALDSDWENVYIDLCIYGLRMCDMPSANIVWGAYLRDKGFIRRMIPDDYIDRYTVEDFCKDNPNGIFVLGLSSHVVCVVDGIIYDTWDSSGEIPLYYWTREEKSE